MFVFRLGLREIIAESGRRADTECKKSSGENKAFNRKDRKLKAAKDAKKPGSSLRPSRPFLCDLCG